MSTSRRNFLKSPVAAAAVLGSRAAFGQPSPASSLATGSSDPYVDDLAMEALNAARAAGASYADVRIGRYRRQSINTRERLVTGVSDSESYGIGVRTLVAGSWGFAATATMTTAGVQQAAQEAARLSRAARTVQRKPVELAPVSAVKSNWRTPVMRDPLDVPIEEKVALLLAATDRGIIVKNRGSWSIDHQRYNFQFSGQVFYEVKNGKITGMIKDVAYQSRTPDFWNSMDMIGGPKSYWLGGSLVATPHTSLTRPAAKQRRG
jgi:TldD protein